MPVKFLGLNYLSLCNKPKNSVLEENEEEISFMATNKINPIKKIDKKEKKSNTFSVPNSCKQQKFTNDDSPSYSPIESPKEDEKEQEFENRFTDAEINDIIPDIDTETDNHLFNLFSMDYDEESGVNPFETSQNEIEMDSNIEKVDLMLTQFEIDENFNVKSLKKNRDISYEDISKLKRLKKSDSIEIIDSAKSKFVNIYENWYFNDKDENENEKELCQSKNSFLFDKKSDSIEIIEPQEKSKFVNIYENDYFKQVDNEELVFEKKNELEKSKFVIIYESDCNFNQKKDEKDHSKNRLEFNKKSGYTNINKTEKSKFVNIYENDYFKQVDNEELVVEKKNELEKSKFVNIYENDYFKAEEESIIEEPTSSQLDNEPLKLLYLNDRYESTVFRKVELMLLNLIKHSYENLNQIIKNKYKIDELNTELCIFLLNQQVSQNENEKSLKTDSKLRWHLNLVASFNSLDILFNSCWDSMILFIEQSMYVHNECIKFDLNEILIQIRKLINPFHKEVKPFKFNDLFSFETPKIYNLCMYLNDAKAKNNRNKFLIIMNESSTLLEKMFKLLKNKNFEISKLELKSLNLYKKYDCFIVDNNVNLIEHLTSFSHVILYETPKEMDSTQLKHYENMKRICKTHKIDFIEFESYKVDFNSKQALLEEITFNKTKQIIVSTKFMNNSDLIECFETKLNFELIERDLSSIIKKYDIEKRLMSDLDVIVDEFTGIKFHDLNDLNKINESEFLVSLRLIRLKIDYYYMIFVPFEELSMEQYLKLTSSVKYLKLTKLLNDLNRNSTNFKIKAIYLNTSNQLAEAVQQVCLNKLDYNEKIVEIQLKHEISDEEIFLISLGCINFYSAQSLKFNFKMIDIMTMDDTNYEIVKGILSKKRLQLINKIFNFK